MIEDSHSVGILDRMSQKFWEEVYLLYCAIATVWTKEEQSDLADELLQERPE